MATTAGVTYTYDGDGQRVKKDNGKLYWYGIAGQVLEETDLSGNLILDYVFFGGMRIARRDAYGNVYYFLGDRLGNARVVTNSTGGVVEESDFYPFGVERPITDTLDNNYKFTGHERDSESGLDHTLYRQYSSGQGRWLSPDPKRGSPANPQSWNRYTYAGNNPCNNIDPDGANEAPAPWPGEAPGYSYGGSGIGSITNFGPEGSRTTNFPNPYGPGVQGGSGGGAGGGFDPCDRNDPTNKAIFAFIEANQEAADRLAERSGLSADFILAWGSLESAWGISRAATRNNNFFGLTGSDPQKSGWIGAVLCADLEDPDNPAAKTSSLYACFANQGLYDSGYAALYSQDQRYLNAALAAQSAGGSIADIAYAVAHAARGESKGFNSEDPNYAGKVSARNDAIQKRKACPN